MARYIFYILAAVLLGVMLLAGRSAGISCDEIIHYDHSVQVYNYFATHGRDTSVLDTPLSNLKYYGQSYDNIVTFVTKWLNIDDVYGFRNIMSALMGWLTIILTALFMVRSLDYRAGIIAMLLMSLTPAFFGHSLNNLKDIPFAFAYISGIYFIFSFLVEPQRRMLNSLMLVFSIAFCISIRAGGLILICYLYLFYFVMQVSGYIETRRIATGKLFLNLGLITVISLAAFMLSTIMWPYALLDPFRNIIGSYRVMAHYPATFRQIFEGRIEWSDHMPWYYLYKSMAITIPLVVTGGVVLFLIFVKKIASRRKGLLWFMLLFTVVFPLIFVVIEKSNLYSSWRQFLFVYPGIAMLSAAGLITFHDSIRKKWLRWVVAAAGAFLCFGPLRFMIANHPYEYIYYNELTGGLKGAYGNYETDYYYVSQTEASEWLTRYLEINRPGDSVRVCAGYSVSWLFRNHPEIKTSWLRYGERSMEDWDYAIQVNRYIPPYQLNNRIWPPENSLHTIYAGGVPVCAVVERKSKDDLYGYRALKEKNYAEAASLLGKAVEVNISDEMIFYNFAAALYNTGKKDSADHMLKTALELNPGFEPALMYLGNIARSEGRMDDAAGWYEKVISSDRKYFEAYVALAELVQGKDPKKARSLLRTCLTMSPRYKPAIIALGNTYREVSPETAEKYYKQANSINN